MTSGLDHNCLDTCLDETRDQDTTFETETETKTKTVKILSREETVSRDFPSLLAGTNFHLRFVTFLIRNSFVNV